jgi:hypothetical protein
VFYLVTHVISIGGLALYGPVLNNPDYVVGSGPDTRVLLGAFFEVILALAIVGTAVTLFSTMRLHKPMDSSIVRRVRFGAVAGCVLGGAVNPVLAQKHTTAPPVRSWSTATLGDGTPGNSIWVENRDSVPVVITRMRISNCVNVQTPCRDSTPAVKVIAPKEVFQVGTILPQDPRRSFSYGFGLDWRVATECKGVAPRLPADQISGAVTPPQPIEVLFLPGAYADKWSGYPVHFFVAADGTTDSTMMINSPPGPFRDILQGIFREYRFSPARFHGCPIPASTELRISRASGLPTPSAYEGFPPTPSELERDTRGPRNPTSPAEPYIVQGACPFECCQYGEWQATTKTPVYASEGTVGPSVFTLRPGDSLKAITGNVHVSRVGRVRIVEKVDRGWAEFEEHKLPAPAVGDTVYILSYAGEGHWEYWYRGLVGTGPELWSDLMGAGIVPGRLVAEPESKWWVHLIDRRGRSGWLIVPPEGFAGYDGCG